MKIQYPFENNFSDSDFNSTTATQPY